LQEGKQEKVDTTFEYVTQKDELLFPLPRHVFTMQHK